MMIGLSLAITSRLGSGAPSAASRIMGSEANGLAGSFSDRTALVRDVGTPANNFSGNIESLFAYTNTNATPRFTRQADGVERYQRHNLYANSAAPANQAILVQLAGEYAVTITGSVSVTATGAATGTWTAGTTTFTAATTVLSLGSTSGSGTVHIRRTPSTDQYVATGPSAVFGFPYEWDVSGNPLGVRVITTQGDLITLGPGGFPTNAATMTLYSRIAFSSLDSNQGIQVRGASASDTLDIRSTYPYVASSSGGADASPTPSGWIATSTFTKRAVAYAANDVAACLNGGTVATDATLTIPVSLDRVRIPLAGANFDGWVSEIGVFPRRFTNAQIQALTA